MINDEVVDRVACVDARTQVSLYGLPYLGNRCLLLYT